jgi:hypothetical protein
MTNAFGGAFGAGAGLAANNPLTGGSAIAAARGRIGTLRPQAPRAPTPQPGVPGAPSTPGQIPPRTNAQFAPDAQYLAQAAQAQFQRQTQLNQIEAEHQSALGSYAEGQRRLMEGVPQQRQDVKEGAAKAGLFYSGQLGKRLGDLETQIARSRADAQSQFNTDERARQAARATILQGGTLDDAAMKAEAVQRQIERDRAAASANQLAPTPVPARPGTKPKPKRRRKPTTGGNVHSGSGSTRRRHKR